MNMKKTIAAVAACAMAVSAMATTVSAVDENATAAKSVHYDLTVKKEVSTADLTFTAKGITSTPTALEIIVPMSIAKSIPTDVNVVVADRSTKTQYTFTFSTAKGANYDGVASQAEADLFTAAGVLGTDGTNDSLVYTINLAASQATAIKKAFDGAADGVDATVTMNGVVLADGVTQDTVSDAVATVGSTFISKATAESGKIALVDGTQAYNGRGSVAKTTIAKPMKSQINTNSETAEIFSILATTGTKSVDSHYVNAKAVVNDMIANYDDVVFTFNTAVDNVLTSAYLADKSWIGNALNYVDYYVTGIPGTESWMGDGQYKSFAQQLYNLFGDEGTGYTYSDSYTFNNLFNAALVANNGYTMNQSTVAPFEYSKTSVSFNWSDLTGGNAYITAANTLNTLQLASSSDWYWDSMDVTGYELAAEDASTEAGVEDEGEDLDDEVDADDVDDIEDVEDVDADDTDDVDVDVEDTEDVDAPVVDNPATGNAPIALAVIPVALAAAAVVAKKRG